MELEENLRLLGLSRKEEKVLSGLQSENNTPLALLRSTKISRTTIYATLENLKRRGLVISRIANGKKTWALADERKIEAVLYDVKRSLLKISEGREEVYGRSDSMVVVHRGVDAVKKVLGNMMAIHKNERFYAFQGNEASLNWDKIFNIEETNKFNREVKKNYIITEIIIPENFFEEHAQKSGIDWGKSFEGRPIRGNVIDRTYFQHAGHLWVFKDSLYLMALNEEIVIEIRNSEIKKMILALFRFVQENSRTIDANEVLRKLMEQHLEKKQNKMK